MIAGAIAEHMEQNGIEPVFLSEKTGMTQHSVDCALSGERNFSVDEYVLICEALDVDYDFFFNKGFDRQEAP